MTDFANHQITDLESKSWRVRDPDKGSYWFHVTWSKGILVLSGDIGNLVLTHYQALAKFPDCIGWVAGSDEGYLLGKSDAKQQYDQDATISGLLELAEEVRSGWDDLTLWRHAASLVGKDAEDLAEEDARNAVKQLLTSKHQIFHSHEIYEATQDAESIAYSWTAHQRLQMQALQFWAKALCEEQQPHHVDVALDQEGMLP